MIKLHGFGPKLGVVDPSPMVLKVDIYMRMAKIEFKSVIRSDNLKKSPKGKLPFIVDGETTLGDSAFIISYLQDQYKVDLDSNLSQEQKSSAYLMGKSLDENLYWCLVYSRWAKDDTWKHLKEAFFGKLPFPLKSIIPPLVRKSVIGALYKQGTGRHSDEEIKTISRKSIQALAEILGEKTYFFGETPCTFDATAFAFLTQYINISLDNEFNDIARAYDNLLKYCDNIKAKYYA